MTTFANATTANFDRAAERAFARDLDRMLASEEQAELMAEYAEQEAEHTDPERFVSEADYFAPTAQDEADLIRLLDIEQHSWTL